MSVISRQYATILPAAEPLPGPTHCFAADETMFILGANKDMEKFLNY